MFPLLAVLLLLALISEPKSTIKVPENYTQSLAYSPDGKTIASTGSYSPTQKFEIHLWDAATAKELKSFPAPKGPVTVVQFRPDGKLLATCASGTVCLWDLDTGKEHFTFKVSSCRYISFHPDGKTIAISDFKTVHIYEVATAKEVATINDGTGAVYTPDGKTLVYRNYPGEIKLWDVGTGKERAALKIDVNETNILACSNGTIAYRGYYPSPRGYSMPTVDLVDFAGKIQFRLIGHENGLLRALAFSPDGRLVASACSDQTVRLWDVGNGKQLVSISLSAYAVAFSPDGKTLATGTRENAIRLWEIAELIKEKK